MEESRLWEDGQAMNLASTQYDEEIGQLRETLARTQERERTWKEAHQQQAREMAQALVQAQMSPEIPERHLHSA